MLVDQYDSQIDQDQMSKSLILAARNNQIFMINRLIEKIRLDVDNFRVKNEDGNTALHMAALHGHAKLTAELVLLDQAGKKAGLVYVIRGLVR